MKETFSSIIESLPSSTKLVAVSKYQPIDKIKEVYDFGQRVFAESRPQELAKKIALLPSDIEWHFIGHLQTNKLKLVLPYVSLIHSVDSYNLLAKIAAWSKANKKNIRILLQVHIASEETKQGFSPAEIEDVVKLMLSSSEYECIHLAGLMAMASNTEDTMLIEREFALLESLFKTIKSKYNEQLKEFRELSIGMSNDYAIALKYGATLIRLGTKIFGERV